MSEVFETVTNQSVKANSIRLLYILFGFVLGAMFIFVAKRLADLQDYVNSDFFKFWLSGRLAAMGQDPYLPDIWVGGHHQFGASWIPETVFIYPLPFSLIFIPFSLVSVYQAFIIWVFLTQMMIVISIIFLLRLYVSPITKHFIFPIFAGVTLFRPTIITLFHGQFSGFILFILACIVFLWAHDKWWQGAALLPFLALKPNLGVLIIGFLCIYLVLQRQWASLVAFGLSGLAILGAGLIQNPYWVGEFLMAGNTKLSQSFGFSPTVWGISALFCNFKLDCSIGFGIILSLFLVGVFFYLMLRMRKLLSPSRVIGIAITITLLLTPYTWPYDQLLLTVPIVIVMLEFAKAGYRFLPVALIFLLIDSLALVMLVVSINNQLEIWNAVIPFCVFILLLCFRFKRSPMPANTLV